MVIINKYFLWGHSVTNNNTNKHKHKQKNNKNQHKIKTNDYPKIPIVGGFIFDC